MAYLSQIFNYNTLAKYTCLKTAGFYRDSEDQFQKLGPQQNFGFRDRMALFKKRGVGLKAGEINQYHGDVSIKR